MWTGWNVETPKRWPTGFVWLVRHGEDRDRDGLTDPVEEASCTDPNDADSDDDGLRDGAEDANHNSALDPGETDPCSADSDGDGIQDGTELGLAMGVPDPDGAGPLAGTDPALFVPDQDPATTTDPLDADSDDDGLNDGEEDANADGAMDGMETDPLDPDSDDDLFSDWVEVTAGTNPLDPESYPVGDFQTSVINEILTSYDGDADVQFVEIHQPALWDDVTNTVLAAFDADGAYLGDVWVLGSTPSSPIWTLGTQELDVGYGLQPDFVIPAALPTGAGMVCWGAPDAPAPDPGTWDHRDPENYVDCVAYGGYAGPSNSRIGTASPHTAAGHSLTRAPGSLNVGDNARDFFCADPATPEGSRGAQAGFLPATTPCPVPALYTLREPLAFSGEGVSGSLNPVNSLSAVSGDPDCTDLSPCLFPFGDTFVFRVSLDEGSASVDAVGAWPFSSAAAGYFPDDKATGPSPIAIFDFALGKGHIFRQPRAGAGEPLLPGQTTEVLFVGAPRGSIATATPPDDEMHFRIWKTSDTVIVEFDTDPAPIPEPVAAALALAALGSLAVLARKRRGREG